MHPHEQNGSFPSQRNECDSRSEWRDDMDFYEEYKDPGKILDAVSRLKIVKDLRFLGGLSSGNAVKMEYRESHPSPHGVTLGIEVEIPEESIYQTEAKNWNEKEKKQYFYEMKEKYAVAEKLGVPSGKDQFWEFAHAPAHSPETLAREVQALIGMGLVNPDYEKFPLHVTIGGISFDPNKTDEGAHILARALDATGWATTGERLIAPYTDPDSNWTSHDLPTGIRERQMDKIAQPSEGEMKTAVEIRTPILRSLFGLDRYLAGAYYLGSALRAYQEQKKNDPIGKQLAKIWRAFAGKCETRFEEEGLTSPALLWTLDTENKAEHSPFKQLAKVLDKAREEPESKEAKFIHDIRLLVISARAEIKEIMDNE
ncbi:MAG: hypothetical protein WC878_02950 [Candidatus Paceibacterota bacterium]|jgi:hypothetical protein